MAIEFNETVIVKPEGKPDAVADRLKALLDRHFPAPAFDGRITGDSTEWRLRTTTDTTSVAASPREAFDEFREHDLESNRLTHSRRLPSMKEGERGAMLRIYYSIDRGELHFDVTGSNRMAVDGAAATCQRMKRALENPETIGLDTREGDGNTSTPTPTTAPVTDAAAPAPASQATSSWLARTWKDHTAQFMVTLVAGVLVVAVALWLGLSPKP